MAANWPYLPAFEDAEDVDSQLPAGWHVEQIENLYSQLPIGKRFDQKSSHSTGSVQVIDQSESGIIGWHDEEPGIAASKDRPVVTFANHTCEMRFMRRPFSVIQNVFPLVGKPGVCDTRFLYYGTKGRVHLEEYKGHYPGYRRTWIPVPPLPEQRAIAHILGTLDDKIELNRRMSETLEAMARALFKSWFIDFDPVRRNAARARNQPSPPNPSPRGRGGKSGHYRGGYDFSGLVETVRKLRQRQTPAEEMFWQLVRNRRFLGLKFRRQHQLGDYVTDFYCHERGLVIELDGGVHSAKRKKDSKRDAWMEAQGLRVVRIPNEQLLDDPASVLETFANLIATPALPLPMGEGRGEGVVESRAFDHLFPAKLVPSELGEIPEGWEVTQLGDLAPVRGGKQLPAKERHSSGLFPVFGANGLMGYADTATHEGFVIAFGRVGAYCGSVHWTYGGAWINNNASSVVPQRWPEFVLQTMLETDFEGLRTGSAQPFIPNSSLVSMQIVRASDRVLDAFCAMVSQFRFREQNLRSDSQTLAALRDTLLPKLISGELRVPDAERIVARAEA